MIYNSISSLVTTNVLAISFGLLLLLCCSVSSLLVQNIQLQLKLCCSNSFSYKNGQCERNSLNNSEITNFTVLQLFYDNIETTHMNNSSESNLEYIYDLLINEVPDLPKCSSQQETGLTHVSVSKYGKDNNFGQIRPNGYLKYNNLYYSPTEYCINRFDEEKNQLELLTCQKSCGNNAEQNSKENNTKQNSTKNSSETYCIPKCCEIDELLESAKVSNCLPARNQNKLWNPKLHHSQFPHEKLTEGQRNDLEIQITHSSFPDCGDNGIYIYQRNFFPDNPKLPFNILHDGGVYYQNALTGIWSHLEAGSYCIDGIYEAETDENEDNNLIYYCEPSNTESRDVPIQVLGSSQSIVLIVYYITLIISSIFLLLTILIHILTLQRQNTHAWTLLCFFISLFCLYISLIMLHGTKLYLDKDPKNIFCWITGVCVHFFFLTTSTWLSVVNFDLWFTFRTLRTLIAQKSNKSKRFILYVIFAFGVPTTILTIALILDNYQRHAEQDLNSSVNFIAPGYAQDGCFFSSDKATFVYLYGPIGFLLLVNLMLFALTILSMYQLKKTASMATSNRNNSHHPQQSFHLFIKLFVLMGVCWIFEVISFLAHPENFPWYWIIFDMINICQGIFIFMIFACKRTTIQILEERSPCFKEVRRIINDRLDSIPCFKNCQRSKTAVDRTMSFDPSSSQEMGERKLSDTELSSCTV